MSDPAQEMNEILSEAYDSVVKSEGVVEQSPQEEALKEEVGDDENLIEEEQSSEDQDTDEEELEEEKENIDEKEGSDLYQSLKGQFSKERIKLLESIDDPDLRAKFIEEGKKERSDLDRKRQELGESKKLAETLDNLVKSNNLPYNRQQYDSVIQNYINLDAMLVKDPAQAIKILADNAKVDLNTLVSVPKDVDSQEDDYRLPEEIERDNKIKALEQKLNSYENQRLQQEQISVQQEVNNFVNAVDENGNLKHPHFERVKQNMALFFNDTNPDMTMEKAYERAVLLDDDLMAQRDADILRKAELAKKEKIEKAKKLKRQSVRSSKVNARTVDHDAALEQAFDSLYA